MTTRARALRVRREGLGVREAPHPLPFTPYDLSKLERLTPYASRLTVFEQ
jgi:hypothetical protein